MVNYCGFYVEFICSTISVLLVKLCFLKIITLPFTHSNSNDNASGGGPIVNYQLLCDAVDGLHELLIIRRMLISGMGSYL